MAILLNGIGVSPGIAIGPIHILNRGAPEISYYCLPEREIDGEIERLRTVIDQAAGQLRALRDEYPSNTPSEVAAFIDAHLLMLEDRLLTDGTIEIIRREQCNAEWALKLQGDRLAQLFDAMEDPYLRTRRDDVEHIIHRVQRMLLGQAESDLDEPENLRNHIVVTTDLGPEEIAVIARARTAGIITETGGPLSHSAILARSLGMPAIVGLHGANRLLNEGEQIIVDGAAGVVIAGADGPILARYRERRRDERRRRRELAVLRDEPAVTLDGVRITLLANIELEDDMRAARDMGAEGVGLYRTEFLYLNRDEPPDEDEQLYAYRRVLRALRGKPITIRTLDLGGDKEFQAGGNAPSAVNPALGLRAIRRCLKYPEIFMPQLRAILRASASGPVKLMIPMLTTIEEAEQSLGMVRLAMQSLSRERLGFDPAISVGGMIEIPAAALVAKNFAQRLDFLSIGTNDLIQYTLAIDRTDEEVNYLYDPANPAVLQLIHLILRAGRQVKKPVAMCGEMAGGPRYTRLLLGLGLREFSMRPAMISEVKSVINTTSITDIRARCAAVLRAPTSDRVIKLLDALNGDT